MRNDLRLEPWSITGTGRDWADDFFESIFFAGNGRMGVRGYLPYDPDPRPVHKGVYLAGIFGEIKPGITDFVNLPTPVWDTLTIDGQNAVLSSEIRRTLHLKEALLTASYALTRSGKRVDVTYTRFFPREQPGLMLQRTVFSPESDMELTVSGGLMTGSCNSPIPDDQTKENTETIQLSHPVHNFATEDGLGCRFEIQGTSLWVEEHISYRCSGFHCTSRTGTAMVHHTSAKAGQPLVLDKAAYIVSSRDVDTRIAPLPSNWNFDILKEQHQADWEKVWAKCDFLLSIGDSEMQTGLRYSMFQLMGSCNTKDATVSIGARGLSHGRYKGCYFWDTDLFMLPFFLENDLEAARNLCGYRVGCLEAAKAHSKSMNTAGARYPWMAALDGSEQCESWDIGCSELHITADVAYALGKYCEKSRDREFYLDKAAEVFIETARFWVSRYTRHPETGEANLMFVKGPDEYCGITCNNLFTNVMVQHNLKLAIQAACDLLKERPALYASLGITQEERARMESLCRAIKWPRDPVSGHLAQDETFHLLEPVDISGLKQNEGASYHRICFDRLQRYKVIKQADTLLLMTRLPQLFTAEEKQAAWKDFEPLCLHDSTLSFASHALFALMNGIYEKGYKYLRKALLLDLRDIMGNTGHEGLHLACMGEAWQAARSLNSSE